MKLKRLWNSLKCFFNIHDYYYQMRVFEKKHDKYCIYKLYVCKNCGTVHKELINTIPITSYKDEVIIIENLRKQKVRTWQEFHKYYFCFLRPKLYRLSSGFVL